MLRKSKFGILIALVAAGCMTANEKSTCEEPKTVTVHDTVTVVKRDTVKVIIHDTILASLPDPDILFGVWSGQAGGKSVTLAFTSSQITIHAADFTANIGATAFDGYIGRVDSAQARITWGGFHDVTWLIDLKNGVLVIQEIGDQMFPAGGATLRKR